MKNKNSHSTITHTSSRKTILPLSDENLICLVMAGQQQAYSEFVKRYERLLETVAGRYCSDHEAIKEIIQDTFVRAFRALPNFRRESKLSTWLCKITASVAISRLRLKRHAAWASLEESPVAETSFYPEELQQLEKQESYHLLKQALGELNERDAYAIELFYFHEQSMEEIHSMTGWSLSNIKSRLCRARQRLRFVMENNDTYAMVYS